MIVKYTKVHHPSLLEPPLVHTEHFNLYLYCHMLNSFFQSMDKEFKKWMKWYGKKHGDYTVSWLSEVSTHLYSPNIS